MIFNKERRIKYLGFNDFWFSFFGIIFLSFVIDFIFNNSFARRPFFEAMLVWTVNLGFTITNWLVIRPILILLRKKYPDLKDDVKRQSLLFLAIVINVIVIDLIGNQILPFIFNQEFKTISNATVITQIIIISTMTIAIYEVIYYQVRLKKSILKEEQAKQAKVQTQLDTLRNQAQPHFLFNTLNTLRDIIDHNSKEDAKQFVDKLSDVYRFILESGNANLTALRDELRFAKAYIHIQSERFGDNLKVNWNIPEEKLEAMVVPMSLQLLLENAIKHNVISRAKPLHITVKVVGEDLIVTNPLQPKSTQLPSTKMGLKNIEKRYTLISNKAIGIEKDETQFIVTLPLLKISDQKQYEGINH